MLHNGHMIDQQSSDHKLATIQYLRALAALSVVFFHANGLAQENFRNQWSSFGAVGVDVFFVISGFVMWVTTSSAEPSPLHFLRNRIIRVVPLYWLVTIVAFVSAYAFRGGDHYRATASEFVQSLLFIPFVSGRTHQIQPILIAGWTLNFEMFFYAVFALVLTLPRNYRAATVAVVLGALVVLGLAAPSANPVYSTFTSPLLIEFLLGCLLGMLYKRGALPRRPVAVALLMLGAVLMLFDQETQAVEIGLGRLVHWGLPAFFLVVGALSMEPIAKPNRILLLLGVASYAIYLIHTIVMASVKDAVAAGWLGERLASAEMFLPAACIAGVAAGLVAYRLVEQPLTGIMRKITAPWPKIAEHLA